MAPDPAELPDDIAALKAMANIAARKTVKPTYFAEDVRLAKPYDCPLLASVNAALNALPQKERAEAAGAKSEPRFLETFARQQYEHVGAWIKRIRDDSEARVLAAIETTQSTSQHSPILEFLVDLTNRVDFKPEEVTRMIIVSDMLQKSKSGVLDMYSKNLDINAITADSLEQKFGARLKLPNIKVEIWQVRGRYPHDLLARAQRAWERIASVYGVELEWQSL